MHLFRVDKQAPVGVGKKGLFLTLSFRASKGHIFDTRSSPLATRNGPNPALASTTP